MNRKQISTTTIEHIVVTSNRSYEQVTASIEEMMGSTIGDMNALIGQLDATKKSWQQASQMIEKRLGKSSFHIFSKIDHGLLLFLAGKARKAVQYTVGNPLLAVQMTQHVAAAALYAPLKLAVYEDDNARTIITYDLLSSLLSQFHNEEVTRIAEHVDSLLEELVTAVI